MPNAVIGETQRNEIVVSAVAESLKAALSLCNKLIDDMILASTEKSWGDVLESTGDLVRTVMKSSQKPVQETEKQNDCADEEEKYTCKTCGLRLGSSEFHLAKKNTNGLSGVCKYCTAKRRALAKKNRSR